MQLINYEKLVDRLFFMFGAICGASLGVALPDGNLLVTAFLALSCGTLMLVCRLLFKRIKDWLRKRVR
jgi:uncharacterized membrane protein YoaK (UPF0700 family)